MRERPHTHTCVSPHTHTHTHEHPQIHTCTHACLLTNVHTGKHTSTSTHMHTHRETLMDTLSCTHACTCISTDKCTNICTHNTCAHGQTHRHTWKLVHTHMHTRGGFQEPARRSQKQKESDIFQVTGSHGVGSVRPSAPSWALEGTSSCSPSPLGRHTQLR